MNIGKSFSFNRKDNIDGDIDEQMSNLYIDPMILEKKCADSVSSSMLSDSSFRPLSFKIPNQTLSVSYAKSPEAVVEGLPSQYFTPNYDPIGPHLEEISTWSNLEMTERFMTKIEEADTDKDVIISHLTSMIDANYSDLLECMGNVKSIDLDLCRAGIQIGHGRRKLRSACEIIHSGAIQIKRLNNKRDELQKLSETIRSLKALKDVHQAMLNCMNTGEVGKAANHAHRVVESLKHDAFDRFSALKAIEANMQKSVITIRQKTDRALKRLCGRKFTASDYESIIMSYLILDHMSETMGMALTDGNNNNLEDDNFEHGGLGFYFDSVGCIEGLSQRINRFQLDDVDACLHSAVMEYIYASQQKKHRVFSELKQQQQQSSITSGGTATTTSYMMVHQMDLGEIVDIAEVPLNLLYRRLTADTIAPCIVRSCELLADVVHTHYLITQWHYTPFAAENHDWIYLHRNCIAEQQQQLLSSTATTTTASSAMLLPPSESPSKVGASMKKMPFAETESVIVNNNNSSSNSNETAIESIVHYDEDDEEEEDDDEDEFEIIETATKEKEEETQDGFDSSNKATIRLSANPAAQLKQWLQTAKQQVAAANAAQDASITSSIISCFDRNFSYQVNSGNSRIVNNNTILQANSDSNNNSNSSSNSSGWKMATAYKSLLQSRSILWEEILRALVNMLSMLFFTAESKLDDFLAMTEALNNMVQLGKEFCNNDSKVLLLALQEKSREYFYNYHCESFQMIRMMLESESWQCVPVDHLAAAVVQPNTTSSNKHKAIPIDSYQQQGGGGAAAITILDVLQSMVVRDDSTRREAMNNTNTTTSSTTLSTTTSDDSGTDDNSHNCSTLMLVRFATTGNPFQQKATRADDVESENGDIMGNSSNCGNYNSNDFHSPARNNKLATSYHKSTTVVSTTTTSGVSGNVDDKKRVLKSFWHLLQEDAEEILQSAAAAAVSSFNSPRSGGNSLSSPSPTATKRYSSSTPSSSSSSAAASAAGAIVTQSALNGIVKYVAKYLQLMYLLPSAALAADIFAHLGQLFDYYLCTVFHGFMPFEEKTKFLAAFTKLTAPAPDYIKEFEVSSVFVILSLSLLQLKRNAM